MADGRLRKEAKGRLRMEAETKESAGRGPGTDMDEKRREGREGKKN